MLQLSFYVPETHLEEVKDALFESGAGEVNNYKRVSWQVKGKGQFCPKKGSNPFLGKVEKLECVTEYKVEMICKEKYIKKVLYMLKKTHPYEEPAYNVIELKEVN